MALCPGYLVLRGISHQQFSDYFGSSFSVPFLPVSQFTRGSLTLILALTPRLRFMQWYTLSSQVKDCLRWGRFSLHFSIHFWAPLLLSSVPVVYFLELFPMALWDHNSPIQKQTRREQPISNNCQSHQNTRSNKQIPNGNHRTLLTMVHPWDTHLLLVFSFFCLGKAAVSHVCGP